MALTFDGGLQRELSLVTARPLTVRLYRNSIPLAFNRVLTDFQACTFPGYLDKDLSGLFSTVVVDPLGRAVTTSPTLVWTRAAGGVPETIYGWIIFDATPTVERLLGGDTFSPPRLFDLAGQSLVLTVASYLQRG